MSHMEHGLTIALPLSAPQFARLAELQAAFSGACNSVTPIVRDARCWNRVALHHLVYRQLRAEFPSLGSQMSCNVIYSVCRAARAVYQHPGSPWNVAGSKVDELPLIRFREDAPVYFDRHTLSLRGDFLSLFTLDGRMRVGIDLSAKDREFFEASKLREIVLFRLGADFQLHFAFAGIEASGDGEVIPGHIVVSDLEIEVFGERQIVLPNANSVRSLAS